MSRGSGGSARAAVLGSPIGHSLSPILHRAAYVALDLDWRYEAHDCDESGLAGLLDGLDDTYVGLSLTMPLKRAVLPLLDDVSPLAAAVGAANTVSFRATAPSAGPGAGRRRIGENTDVGGIVAAVRAGHAAQGSAPDGGGALRLTTVTILGAGGTAAACLAAVRELGWPRVSVVVRDPDRASALAAAATRLGVDIEVVRWPGGDAMRDADLVISTVPAGATDALVDAVVGAAAPPVVRAGQLVFDVLYDPWPTPFAGAAAAAGAQVIGGLELLVQQAALQVELWSGRAAPVDVMRAAGRAALETRGAGA